MHVRSLPKTALVSAVLASYFGKLSLHMYPAEQLSEG